MQVELEKTGYGAETEHPVKVHYKGRTVGDYSADLFIDRKVLVELKVAKIYNKKDEAQILNVLKATGVEIGMLVNFGLERVDFKRFVYTDNSSYRPPPLDERHRAD